MTVSSAQSTVYAGQEINWWRIALLSLAAVASFHLAYLFPSCAFLMIVFLFCLLQLTNITKWRPAFYTGLAIGLLLYIPQMGFLWTIFGPAAIALWCILALWIGLFLALGGIARWHFHPVVALSLMPFLWTGLEYFRSELYYLRFSWLNVGYAFSPDYDWSLINSLGTYGIAFMAMAVLVVLETLPRRISCLGYALLLILALSIESPKLSRASAMPVATANVQVAGIQMEFPPAAQIPFSLDALKKKYPKAELLVLSEYTFDGPVPEKVTAWCRRNRRYLIVGGKDPATNSQYYNTAYVIGPKGQVVFQQAKSVPIQFFKDGLPATEQKLWNSPWGKIGICICYDLSYTRVTDELVRQGAQAIIVPTMDVSDWGMHQHELHGRIAPFRAAEYGIPIFRVASSGISQSVDASGRVIALAPAMADEGMICSRLELARAGTLPLDRVIAPASSAITGLAMIFMFATCWRKRNQTTKTP